MRQPLYEQLKVKGHLRVCGNREFWNLSFAPNAFTGYKFSDTVKQGFNKNSN